MLRESPFKHYNIHSLIKGMKTEHRHCAACSEPITDKYLLQVSDQTWHAQCLRCCICQLELEKQRSCFIKDDSIYCKQDYAKSFGAKCSKCSRGISSSDWVRKARNHVYHLACFACDACKRQLSTGEEFALHEDRVLCKIHYLELVDGGTTSSDDGGDSEGYHSKSKAKRVRTTFTEEQLQVLQANFQLDSNPDGQDLERIAQITGLSKRVTQVWFQNSRARQKKHLHTSKIKPTSLPHNNNTINESNSFSRQINLHLTYSFQQHQQLKTSPVYIPQHPDYSDEEIYIPPLLRTPKLLVDISLDCVLNNIEKVFLASHVGYEFPDNLALPEELCQMLVDGYQGTGKQVDDRFLNIFRDKTKTLLSSIRIVHSPVTVAGLRNALQYGLREVVLTYCPELDSKAYNTLNRYGERIETLAISNESRLFRHLKEDPAAVFDMPNLRRLTFVETGHIHPPSFFDAMFINLNHLTHLNLSNTENLGDMRFLSTPQLQQLRSLTLYNCKIGEVALANIQKLKNLYHLDISQIDHPDFPKPNKSLRNLVTSLPKLVSLDISGTNLAGKGTIDIEIYGEMKAFHSDIPGLGSRIKNPLNFLGLYNTQHGACRRHFIPAHKISGDANETQVITAGIVYMERPGMLHNVLNDLFHILRTDTCSDIEKALKIILDSMNAHFPEKRIQISGSAALFYIVRNKTDSSVMTTSSKNHIIMTLLNSMEKHIDDETMLRNGCLTLCQFKMPHDLFFTYVKAVKILLKIIMENKQTEGFVQRIAIYLMNSCACQVNDAQKKILGQHGLIEKMLTLINDRIENDTCDDVLEVAWSTMWNVTDENPENCKRFLDSNGMTCFIHCLELFREKNELMRNMMGLLGNVAEVKELRHRLMPYMKDFYELVDSFQDGIEVSYNAAGIISHMASDGVGAWTDVTIRREVVLNRMVASVERWDINSERNINYRSFQPILDLTRVQHTPQCQHWAVWALANLTKVYPEKYCPILEREKGLAHIAMVLQDPKPYQRIRELALMVLDNYERYKKSQVRPARNLAAMEV